MSASDGGGFVINHILHATSDVVSILASSIGKERNFHCKFVICLSQNMQRLRQRGFYSQPSLPRSSSSRSVLVSPQPSALMIPSCRNYIGTGLDQQKHWDWTNILGLLAEIYLMPNLKMNLKFDMELLKKESCSVALRSQKKRLEPGINLYIVDTLGELRQLYRLTPIAIIGGSFLPGLAGHNLSKPAAVGSVVLTCRFVV